MEAPRAKQSRSAWVPGRLVTMVFLFWAVVVSGCSTPTGGSGRAPTSTTETAPATTGTSTSGPVASTPLEVAQVTMVLSGSTVQFTFAAGVVTGPLGVTALGSDSGQTGVGFTITGVDYTANGASTSGGPDGLVTGVNVSASGSGLRVHIGLRRAGSTPHFTFGRDQVVVTVS